MEGWYSFYELHEVGEFILVEFIEHPEFLEVVHNQCLEVYVQFNRVVLTAPQYLLVPIHKFLLEDHTSHLQLTPLALPLCGLLGLFGDIKGGFEFLVLLKGRIIEDGHFSMVHKILNAEVLL